MKQKNEIPRETASVNAEGNNRREPVGKVLNDDQLDGVIGGLDFPFKSENNLKNYVAYGQDKETGNQNYMPTPAKPNIN